MEQHPLVSIIMPVYNMEKYVADSIQSILDQTYPAIELIAINDGSTDGSWNVITLFGDKVVTVNRATNGGIAAGRNDGLAVATGQFIAFADADDLWELEKLSEQMRQFATDPNLDISFCMIQNFISPELPADIQATRHCPPDPMPGKISGTAVIKRSSFDRVGNLNPNYRVGEFIDWMARATEQGLTHAMVEKVLYRRRIHDTNTGVIERPSRADYLKIVKAALDRKRASE